MHLPAPEDPCPCRSGLVLAECCGAEIPGVGYTKLERVLARAKLNDITTPEEMFPLVDHAMRTYLGPLFAELSAMDDRGLPDDFFFVHPFESWLWFDYESEGGSVVVDQLLSDGADLSDGERRYLELLRRSSLRLYEVEEVVYGESATFLDVVTGERFVLRGRAATDGLFRLDSMAIRFIPGAASPRLEEMVPLPLEGSRRRIARVNELFSAWRAEHPVEDVVRFFKQTSPLLHREWVEARLAEPDPAPHLVS